eukprot:TRINITY_DN6470_c0_g1_i1.p1 TRINITY_DN6470_c0_g1~~TRINITY_DN6470_c0_g1_i1.p1  ORF type:complete len:321 (-),score=67.66 TRINITY_DN6470_c0_g1_i1:205-1167(-)
MAEPSGVRERKDREREKERERMKDIQLGEYFQTQQISTQVTNALKQLVRLKPADPAAFLADQYEGTLLCLFHSFLLLLNLSSNYKRKEEILTEKKKTEPNPVLAEKLKLDLCMYKRWKIGLHGERQLDFNSIFIIGSFKSQVRNPGELVEAKRVLKAISIGSPEYMLQVSEIFQKFQTQEGLGDDCISGESYNRFIRLVCGDLPFEISKAISSRLDKGDRERVSFAEFSSAVSCIHIYLEITSKAEVIFRGCNLDQNGWAKKTDLVELLEYLHKPDKDPQFLQMCRDSLRMTGDSSIISYREFLSKILSVSLGIGAHTQA